MTSRHAELLRGAWNAFARGDIDAAVDVLDPGVRWYAADAPDGEEACRTREEAAAFLRRALAEGMSAELLDVRDAGDRLVAVIHTHAPPGWERGPEPHGEVVTFRGDMVTEMVVDPTVEDALYAAGLVSG